MGSWCLFDGCREQRKKAVGTTEEEDRVLAVLKKREREERERERYVKPNRGGHSEGKLMEGTGVPALSCR